MARENILTSLRDQMRSRYGVRPEKVRFVRAPYRICPLGAHIDHQLGTVTAMAIDQGVHLAFASSGSAEVVLGSLSYPGEVRFNLNNIPLRQAGDWGNYARGAALALRQSGVAREGIVGITHGELAEGGLSSSAAIGLAYLLALEQVNDRQCPAAENVRLEQVIENGYLGLNNGILDQSAILFSRHQHLTVIDCKSFAARPPQEPGSQPANSIRLVPRPDNLPSFAIVVAFSGLTQAITATDYNKRVAECAKAARILLQAAGRPLAPAVLAEVSEPEYLAHRFLLSGPLARRAGHFFSEMNRVRQGLQAWEAGDLAGFGRLMTASGESSIKQYECGSRPLMDLYELLVGTPGIHGARFSGAGFRGCCIALAEPKAAQQALPELQRAYAARQPDLAGHARFLICQSDDGARILPPEAYE